MSGSNFWIFLLQVLKLLEGDEEVWRWAKEEVSGWEDDEVVKNIQCHLNMALLEDEDDSISIGSRSNISLEDYLRGRWSRTSSFD